MQYSLSTFSPTNRITIEDYTTRGYTVSVATLSFAIGTVGFVAVALGDLLQIPGRKQSARAVSSIGYAGIAASLLFLMFANRPASAPRPLLVLEAIGVCAFGLLLLYSVLLEIPLARRRGRVRSTGEDSVVETGSYALVRHPGFLWFALMWLAIILIYLNTEVTEIGAAMVVLDFLLVVAEDLYFFPRIFSDYEEYKKRTPFLLPRIRVR